MLNTDRIQISAKIRRSMHLCILRIKAKMWHSVASVPLRKDYQMSWGDQANTMLKCSL